MSKHAVICPWIDEHTTGIPGDDGDTSTVIFEPNSDHGWAFKCLHAHCVNRTVKDVLEKLGLPSPNSFLSHKTLNENKTNFSPITAKDLLAQNPGAIKWIWEPYLPEGTLILLVAYMKVGKSTLVYSLAVAVARGLPFLKTPT